MQIHVHTQKQRITDTHLVAWFILRADGQEGVKLWKIWKKDHGEGDDIKLRGWVVEEFQDRVGKVSKDSPFFCPPRTNFHPLEGGITPPWRMHDLHLAERKWNMTYILAFVWRMTYMCFAQFCHVFLQCFPHKPRGERLHFLKFLFKFQWVNI